MRRLTSIEMRHRAFRHLLLSLIAAGLTAGFLSPRLSHPSGFQSRPSMALSPAPGLAQETEGETGEDIEERDNWFAFQRAYPQKVIPAEARRKAWAGRLGGRFGIAAVTENAPAWRSIGPSPTNAFYFNNRGQTSGRINTIAVSPADPRILLIGSATGGIWRSTDGGSNFLPVSDNQADLAVGSIAFSKSDPAIAYAGMGDLSGGYLGSGVSKTTDSGRTWQRVSNQSLPSPGTIARLAIHPTDPNLVYVAQYTQLAGEDRIASGFYLSTDGGVNWQKTFNGRARDLAIDPADANTLYLGVIRRETDEEEVEPGLYKSSDGGNSWALILKTPYDERKSRDVRVAPAPSRPGTLYVFMGGFFGEGLDIRVVSSTDGGASWTDRGDAGIDRGGFGYNTYLAVDPTNADTIYAGTRDIYRSLDGGASWTNITQVFGAGGFTPLNSKTHEDQHDLAFSPANANEFYIANDGGLSKTFDGGNSFVSLNRTLKLSQFISLAVHPTNPDISYGGTQDNGTQRRLAGPDQWKEFSNGDGGRCVINPLDPGMVFITYIRGAVYRYVNDGQTFDRQIAWNPTFGEPDFNGRIAFYPPFTGNGVDSTLYFGTWRLFVSTNLGGSWITPAGDLDLTLGFTESGRDVLSAIAVSRSDTRYIYTGSAQGRAMASSDGGISWTDVTEGLPRRFITSIKVDPTDPAIAYLTVSGFGAGHVYKTTNGGAGWEDISGNLPDIPANDLIIDPVLSSILYLATDAGVFRTATAGVDWQEFNRGLPPVVAQAFTAQPGGLIQLATYGRGAYELTGEARSSITSVIFDGKKKMTISGSRLPDAPRVLINGKDQSSHIKTASDTIIKIKGKPNKLGLGPGDNRVQVTDSSGLATNVFILKL